jgi:hypothetical protein
MMDCVLVWSLSRAGLAGDPDRGIKSQKRKKEQAEGWRVADGRRQRIVPLSCKVVSGFRKAR